MEEQKLSWSLHKVGRSVSFAIATLVSVVVPISLGNKGIMASMLRFLSSLSIYISDTKLSVKRGTLINALQLCLPFF